ncbi:MAG: ribonuclease P protein component [Deltaproteobacteria bacterium]|nr:ribonuclease P protein component [Deltaproteobacteria bacterium]
MEEVALNARFHREFRIRKSREYQRHRARSRTYHTSHFLVTWAPSKCDNSRLGLTVSRKVGRAHQRNLTKRRLRHWFRHMHHELKAPWDLVVIARPGAAELDFSEMAEQLRPLVTWLNRKSEGRA